MGALYIGLMSGTSLDGVDGVLADFSAAPGRVLAHASAPFPDALRAELLALNTSGPDELHRAALAGNGLVRVYAQVVQDLLARCGVAPGAVRAIGAHGQTVRHRPQEFDGTGYTLQLNQPALLAELTGIPVVADFRSRDVAAGGQGAPLAPFFHRAWFGRPGQALGLLNIGGISNLTVLRADGSQLGFDCGPGNALMDGWCQQHLGRAYDDRGAWAASGRVHEALLAALQSDAYFSRPPPKSTGRDLFHLQWLAGHLAAFGEIAPENVQATLAELTARACADDLMRHAPGLGQLVVCGGGALNDFLMQRLAALLPGVAVAGSQAAGLPPLQVEAAAFAWLARKALEGEKLDLQSTTGARGARVLGCVYPA
ncbi:anhydro-N-acetylmuramic acid kinase [Ramlibacter sp. MAHUQ-53]|uniref:anhydro-N-acetylmuramic acid kinase n=1 Tax=unclassified Ramlibacter TaxID=2617605 RepID=UPI003627B85D